MSISNHCDTESRSFFNLQSLIFGLDMLATNALYSTNHNYHLPITILPLAADEIATTIHLPLVLSLLFQV